MTATPTVPISATYLNVQEARASAALEAASAWDPTPTEMPCPYFSYVTLNFTYTRGGAAGAFDWQLETSPYSVVGNVPVGAQEWQDPAIYASGAVVAGVDTQSLDQREYETYTATGAAVETFAIGAIPLEGTFERARVVARESGNAGAPGTLQVEAVFS